jgi:hypothetical protein
MSNPSRGSLTKNSLIMIIGQIVIKALAFFLPFMRHGYLELSISVNMATLLP